MIQNSDNPDYIVDIDGLAQPTAKGKAIDSNAHSQGRHNSRPFIGVRFECCSVYARIYRNANGTAYVGWCPRCSRQVKVRVGREGTSSRFFRAQ